MSKIRPMTYLLRHLPWILLLALSLTAQAAEVSLTDAFLGQDHYPAITQYADILEDPGGQFVLADVISTTYAQQFTPSPASSLDMNFTSSAYWLRIHLVNNTPERNWYLRLPGSLSRHGELYMRAGSDDATLPFAQQPSAPRFRDNLYPLTGSGHTLHALHARAGLAGSPVHPAGYTYIQPARCYKWLYWNTPCSSSS